MFARLSAFVIWSLVAATGVFWALRLSASPPPVPTYAVAVGNAVAVRGDLSRLFGAPARAATVAQATPEAPSRFKLIGVMAPGSRSAQAEVGQGLALIAVDGKPAKPFAVGARLDSDLVLQSVGLRTAAIGPAQGARSVLLELPALATPVAGTLPPAPAGASTRMQSAIQATQAAQAAQGAVPALQGGQGGQGGQGALGQCAVPGTCPSPSSALAVPQAPVMPPVPVAPSPAPDLPTPGGLPSR